MMRIKWLKLLLMLLILTGCQSATSYDQRTAPEQTTVAAKRQLPKVTQEPLIAVFLKQGSVILLSLSRDGVITVNDKHIRIPKGKVRFRLTHGGIISNVTGSQVLGNSVHIQVPYIPGSATFRTKVFPPSGGSQKLALVGEPEILIDPASKKLILVELVGLETYLRGVLPKEISPSWPLEAIKAQAVVARSYTLDRYLRRFDRPWHLHWHFTVDMAYGGLKRLNTRMAVALEQTRGQVIAAGGLPVPAFFHACSGGRTESALNFRPALTGADDVTPMAQVMPSVVDPYAIRGARALRMLKTHINWRAKLSLYKVNAKLRKWMRNHPKDRVPLGTVKSIRLGERFADSGKLKTVIIQHRLRGRKLETAFSAGKFRLAVGPGLIRSTNWQSCKLSANRKSLWVKGRGYGHGVGLSQVSAYQMAKEGHLAGDIVRHFYPGAKLAQWWK